jgi:hypothetical protein
MTLKQFYICPLYFQKLQIGFLFFKIYKSNLKMLTLKCFVNLSKTNTFINER